MSAVITGSADSTSVRSGGAAGFGSTSFATAAPPPTGARSTGAAGCSFDELAGASARRDRNDIAGGQRQGDPPAGAVSVPQPPSRRPWSLRDRLDERTRLELIAAYRAGATATSIASGHGLSVRSVKRLVAAAGVRRKQVPT
jgi:hypothetical protein